ncbi:hypothetical protein D9M71_109290 [compost metagenome]
MTKLGATSRAHTVPHGNDHGEGVEESQVVFAICGSSKLLVYYCRFSQLPISDDGLNMLADILLAGLIQLGHFQLRQPHLAIHLSQRELRQAVFRAVENEVVSLHISHLPLQ